MINKQNHEFNLSPSFWGESRSRHNCIEIRGKPIRKWVIDNHLEAPDPVTLHTIKKYKKFGLSKERWN